MIITTTRYIEKVPRVHVPRACGHHHDGVNVGSFLKSSSSQPVMCFIFSSFMDEVFQGNISHSKRPLFHKNTKQMTFLRVEKKRKTNTIFETGGQRLRKGKTLTKIWLRFLCSLSSSLFSSFKLRLHLCLLQARQLFVNQLGSVRRLMPQRGVRSKHAETNNRWH